MSRTPNNADRVGGRVQRPPLTVKLLESDGHINVYAGPATDWAVLRRIPPRIELKFLATLAALCDACPLWLQVELPSGVIGWITQRSVHFTCQWQCFERLPKLSREDVQVQAIARRGAAIYELPDSLFAGCGIRPGDTLVIHGRNPDGAWLRASYERARCWPLHEGWIRVTDLEPNPIFEAAPVVLAPGRWRLPTRAGTQPAGELLADSCGLNPRNRAYAPIPAPIGGHTLSRGRTRDPGSLGFGLYVTNADDERTYIGELYLYIQGDRLLPLASHARWSPDGRYIVFTDVLPYPYGDIAERASNFWLYSLFDDRIVDLRREQTEARTFYADARFHPDGDSIYVLQESVLRRVTLAGDPWPGFQPIEDTEEYLLSPRGDRMLVRGREYGANVPEYVVIYTDQGQQLTWRRGTRFHWMPDSDHIAYRSSERWYIEHLDTGERSILTLPEDTEHRWPYESWSPSGRHLAVLDWNVRILDISGELVSVHRTAGFPYILEWAADGSELYLDVMSDSCPLGP